MKNTDVRTIRKDGETYANVNDLIRKINEHGTVVSTAFKIEEFRRAYEMGYVHITELLELIKEH